MINIFMIEVPCEKCGKSVLIKKDIKYLEILCDKCTDRISL